MGADLDPHVQREWRPDTAPVEDWHDLPDLQLGRPGQRSDLRRRRRADHLQGSDPDLRPRGETADLWFEPVALYDDEGKRIQRAITGGTSSTFYYLYDGEVPVEEFT